MDNRVVFLEVQKPTQWWLWFIILIFLFSSLYVSIHEFTKTDSLMNWENWVSVLIPFLISILFFIMRLKTRIDSKGVFVQFIPFHLKEHFFSWNDIQNCALREYSPVGEYGGWGIKYGMGGVGKAYNISGNIGL